MCEHVTSALCAASEHIKLRYILTIISRTNLPDKLQVESIKIVITKLLSTYNVYNLYVCKLI